jgi:hypothetical protein
MFLTLEQASEMTLEECQSHLKKLARKYKLEKSILEVWEELWPITDELSNTILYLEDRIDAIELGIRLKYANDARWGRLESEE